MIFMSVLGIDEAGRGPVIGPMVVCGVQCRCERNIKKLKKLKLKDSKQLSAKKREELFDKIKEICEIETIVLEAEKIDELRLHKSLNVIELDCFIQIINKLSANKVYIDLPERGDRFKVQIIKNCNRDIELIAEHKADEKYLIVSAASIIAKVLRDNKIKRIEKEIGVSIGSGYPSDPYTKKYLQDNKNNLNKKEIKKYIRHSWQTIKNLIKNKNERKLTEYFQS
jgi:ribonuclease HII